jgi:hypothetical protein
MPYSKEIQHESRSLVRPSNSSPSPCSTAVTVKTSATPPDRVSGHTQLPSPRPRSLGGGRSAALGLGAGLAQADTTSGSTSASSSSSAGATSTAGSGRQSDDVSSPSAGTSNASGASSDDSKHLDRRWPDSQARRRTYRERRQGPKALQRCGTGQSSGFDRDNYPTAT